MRLTVERTKRFDVPGDEDGGFINVRVLSDDEIAEIESISSTTTYGGGETAQISVDLYKRNKEIVRKCLVGIGNFFDERGNEIKFKKGRVSDLAKYSISTDEGLTRFFVWVEKCHNEAKKEIEEGMEEARKN